MTGAAAEARAGPRAPSAPTPAPRGGPSQPGLSELISPHAYGCHRAPKRWSGRNLTTRGVRGEKDYFLGSASNGKRGSWAPRPGCDRRRPISPSGAALSRAGRPARASSPLWARGAAQAAQPRSLCRAAAMLSALGIHSAAFLFRDGFHFLSFRAGSVYGISHGSRLHRKSAAAARRYRLTFCVCF